MKHFSAQSQFSRAIRKRSPSALRWLTALCVALSGCSGYISCGSNADAEAVGAAPAAAPAPQAPAPAAPPATAAPEPAAPAAPASPAPAASRRRLKLLEGDVPKLTAHVTDKAGLLDDSERSALEHLLDNYERRTGHQVAVLTVKSLGGANVSDFGFTVVSRAALGRRGKDDGVLITVAPHDRKIDIQVGRGLEQAIPDELAARVIRDTLAPAFHGKRYGSGLTNAALELMRAGEAAQ